MFFFFPLEPWSRRLQLRLWAHPSLWAWHSASQVLPTQHQATCLGGRPWYTGGSQGAKHQSWGCPGTLCRCKSFSHLDRWQHCHLSNSGQTQFTCNMYMYIPNNAKTFPTWSFLGIYKWTSNWLLLQRLSLVSSTPTLKLSRNSLPFCHFFRTEHSFHVVGGQYDQMCLEFPLLPPLSPARLGKK